MSQLTLWRSIFKQPRNCVIKILVNFYTIALPRGWWILLDFEKNVLTLQRIYLVNSYTFVWHKSFCQMRKTSRILEIKKFRFNAIFDWFPKKITSVIVPPGGSCFSMLRFSSLMLFSDTVLHFCCCCVFTTFKCWWILFLKL